MAGAAMQLFILLKWVQKLFGIIDAAGGLIKDAEGFSVDERGKTPIQK